MTARSERRRPGQSLEVLHEFLDAAAPFHIVFDRALRVTHTGRSIVRLCPDLKAGQGLDEHLTLECPAGALTSELLYENLGSLVLFRARATNATLRGELIELRSGDQLCFVGSPWVHDLGELRLVGLTPADFTVSDPVLDHMLAQNVDSDARKDAQRLARRLQELDAEKHRLTVAEQGLAARLDALFDLVMRVDRAGRIGYLRSRPEMLLSNPPESAIGLRATETFPEMGDRLETAVGRAFDDRCTEAFTYHVTREGVSRDFEARVLLWSADEALVLVRDVTERTQLEQRLTRQAFQDPLTGLGNRALFYDRSQHALARRDGQRHVAALFIDIDDFKLTNDGLGHQCGDELLTAVANRLSSCVRPGDTLARLGGDEFAILLEDAGASAARTFGKRILRTMSRPFRLFEHEIPVTVSVGVAVAGPEDHVDELLRKAGVAMYRAKAEGKCRFASYRASTDVSLNRIEAEAELRRALENGELRVWYQPIIELKTRAVIGFEALVRWDHPTRGMLTPGQFIPLAEQSTLIVQVGEQVLRSACHQARQWQRSTSARSSPSVSVNISPRQLTDRALVKDVERILSDSGLDPRLLVLEITETALMPGHQHALDTLHRLHQLGLAIALDDFGTGYSSLSRLQHFPVNSIKIDKSFVDGISDGGQGAAFARVVIQLARIVGVESVAEGVECPDQLNQLAALDCDSAQGYIFSPPVPPQQATSLLAPTV
jgi:diguanylate cyclase (GGDEF)-like protein